MDAAAHRRRLRLNYVTTLALYDRQVGRRATDVGLPQRMADAARLLLRADGAVYLNIWVWKRPWALTRIRPLIRPQVQPALSVAHTSAVGVNLASVCCWGKHGKGTGQC